MIVVIGLPAYVESDDEGEAGGLAADVAVAAHGAGSAVELVGKIGDDAAGDAVVLALGRAGVGHAALLRDPGRPTPLLAAEPEAEPAAAEGAQSGTAEREATEREPTDAEPTAPARLYPLEPDERPQLEAGDVALGLQYLNQAAVVVVAEPLAVAALAAVVDGAAFAGAQLVAVVPAGAGPADLPPQATVLEAPPADDGSFARLVGTFAAGLDRGVPPAEAFAGAVEASGWEPLAG
jgi:hypothetical protein